MESIGRSFRTAGVVVVITLLIWIEADQWVTKEEDLSVTVQPVAASRDHYVAFAEPPFHRTVTIHIRGRRSRIAALRSKYEGTPGEVIRIPVDGLRTPSTQPFSLDTREEMLRLVPELRQAGNVVSAEPETMEVRIDRFVEVADIPIRFDYGELRVRDKPETRKVLARMPEFVADNEQFKANRHAVVHAAPLVGNRAPGTEFSYDGDVSLELPMDLPPGAVQLFPATVSVTGNVDTLESQKQIGPLTVKWFVPDNVQREYVIVAENQDDLVALYRFVRGPKERIELLDASKIRAFVEILAADLTSPGPGKTIIRDVVFTLPPDFSDCKLVETTDPRQVKFHLERRGPANGSAVESGNSGN